MSRARKVRVEATLDTMTTFDGTPGWSDRSSAAEVRFLGRSADGGRGPVDAAPLPVAVPRQATMRQVHGATVLAARQGACGEGDALVTTEPGLALLVVTADCVPILVATDERVAAIHAGWRGLVGGVIAAALSEFADPGRATAWIGPAIGPCCYEVGEDVAGPVLALSSPEVRAPGRRGRPHLDLGLAAEIVLERCGVGEIRRLALCTSCHPRLLESYRRDGVAAGRNRSLIWLRGAAGDQDD